MVAVTIKLEGYAELDEALAELPKATERNVLKRALIKAADPIVSEAERLAPVFSGKLQKSIDAGTKLSRRQKSLHSKQGQMEVFIGPAALVQAITQEFGTVNNRPQPFLRPAWEGNWRKALDLIKEELANEIEKARARLARKAARLAG